MSNTRKKRAPALEYRSPGQLVIQGFNPVSRRESYLDNKLKISSSGTVEEIFNQKRNHNILTLRLGDKTWFELPPEWEHKFKVGDSIAKMKGSLLVEHYRDDDILHIGFFAFEYSPNSR